MSESPDPKTWGWISAIGVAVVLVLREVWKGVPTLSLALQRRDKARVAKELLRFNFQKAQLTELRRDLNDGRTERKELRAALVAMQTDLNSLYREYAICIADREHLRKDMAEARAKIGLPPIGDPPPESVVMAKIAERIEVMHQFPPKMPPDAVDKGG